jgi:hypothetical protein
MPRDIWKGINKTGQRVIAKAGYSNHKHQVTQILKNIFFPLFPEKIDRQTYQHQTDSKK